LKSLVLNGYGFCNNSGSLAAIRRLIEIASLYSGDVQIGQDCNPQSAMYRHAAASIKIAVWRANTALSYSAMAAKALASKRY
jgi:hypothetical protein